MAHHKYKVGQRVNFEPGKMQENAPSGDYTITRLMPTEGRDCQYRIKSKAELCERVARESQLSFRSLV